MVAPEYARNINPVTGPAKKHNGSATAIRAGEWSKRAARIEGIVPVPTGTPLVEHDRPHETIVHPT
jgi:hypothetical protein